MSAIMSFYGDADTGVHLHDYGTKRAPILALDGNGCSLSVSAFNAVPIADHLAFAKALAAATADYLAALETYAAARPNATQAR
ncbi:hypothetical protein QCN29_31085 [Streptomyces sp. HNM0663]|uniref:Uncharacterized protein n=1 Tax=Streptomyces chengmaiensis TaxID=3040919 RepID=A0ABT6HWS5_9ACTN|nr:hypothetical protein [Streptomyces chengmaiensis]MDH2393143.1 hypothetical protein [Streptomyces chengmaiensis]